MSALGGGIARPLLYFIFGKAARWFYLGQGWGNWEKFFVLLVLAGKDHCGGAKIPPEAGGLSAYSNSK
jgi:hypothetical protein